VQSVTPFCNGYHLDDPFFISAIHQTDLQQSFNMPEDTPKSAPNSGIAKSVSLTELRDAMRKEFFSGSPAGSQTQSRSGTTAPASGQSDPHLSDRLALVSFIIAQWAGNDAEAERQLNTLSSGARALYEARLQAQQS